MTPLLLAIRLLGLLAFAGIGAWQAWQWRNSAARVVSIACIATAAWLGATVAYGFDSPAGQIAESLRNLAWLSFLYVLLWRGGKARGTLGALYAALGFVVALTAVTNASMLLDPRPDPSNVSTLYAIFSLRMVFAVGALAAVHNLYTATTSGARAGVGIPLAALAAMWTIDLTLYALSWRAGSWALGIAAMRAPVILALAPLLALAVRRNTGWSIRLSRSVAFRSVGLVAALLYLALVIALASALDAIAAPAVALVMPLILSAAALLALAVMASPDLRAWGRVMLAKHFFAHRYDYRAEWLRFTDTLGIAGSDAAPLEVRVVKAIADIVSAPGGMLLVPAANTLSCSSRWQWPGIAPPVEAGGEALAALLARGRIVELDPLRAAGADGGEAAAIPEWIVAELSASAIVPLVHFDRLVGAVLLERPPGGRPFDWEDFDLLRLVGRQVASYLAEAQSQEALGDAARFDEFNRRFAFIMHDIKNLVSQLTLVTRNAERHADKPEFRADMIATLQSSTARMNDLLARLSQHNSGRAEVSRPTDLQVSAASVASRHRAHHPVVVTGDDAFALADPARLEQALSHLVQNAIDASPLHEPVIVSIVAGVDEAGLEVADRGAGMSAEFVRGSLFRAFTSTKPSGFGIGAYEARALISAMGGRIGVVTAPGEGSRITIWLPAAQPQRVRIAA